MSPITELLVSKQETLLQQFGTDHTYQRAAGGTLTIRAIPIDPARLEAASPGTSIMRWVRLSDFGVTPPANGDAIIAGGGTYRVVAVDANTHGGAFLALQKT